MNSRLKREHDEIVDDAMVEVLRDKTPTQRIKIGFSLWESSQKMLFSHLKSIHSDWSLNRVQKEVARRLSHGAV